MSTINPRDLRKSLGAFIEDARSRIKAAPDDHVELIYVPTDGFSLRLLIRLKRGGQHWWHGEAEEDPSDAVDSFVAAVEGHRAVFGRLRKPGFDPSTEGP